MTETEIIEWFDTFVNQSITVERVRWVESPYGLKYGGTQHQYGTVYGILTGMLIVDRTVFFTIGGQIFQCEFRLTENNDPGPA